MKFRDLIYKLIYFILATILTPFLTTIGSFLTKGDYFYWVYNSPLREIVLALSILLPVLVLVFIRLKTLNQKNVGMFTIPIWGFEDIGIIQYENVKWIVMSPREGPPPCRVDTSPQRIQIRTPPRCLKCGTEIEQSHSFWGGYIWKCVGCGFKKRSQDSYYRVA